MGGGCYGTRVYLIFGQIVYIENFPLADLYQLYKSNMLSKSELYKNQQDKICSIDYL